MAGVAFDFLLGVVAFLAAVWCMGRLFRLFRLPRILGELLVGILMGPECLDVVPFASDGTCPVLSLGAVQAPNGTATYHRFLGIAGDCRSIHVFNGKYTQDVWSFAGTLGVTMLIMESGMHINFEKLRLVGLRACVVAVIGTAAPLLAGMRLVTAFFGQDVGSAPALHRIAPIT